MLGLLGEAFCFDLLVKFLDLGLEVLDCYLFHLDLCFYFLVFCEEIFAFGIKLRLFPSQIIKFNL